MICYRIIVLIRISGTTLAKKQEITVVHDFNGHEVNGIHGLNGKKCYDKALYLVNNRHDFKGMHDLKGNFPYDDFFRKTHARLYFASSLQSTVVPGFRALGPLMA